MIETTLSANDCDAMVVAPLQAETVATQIANTDLPIVAIDTAIDSDKGAQLCRFQQRGAGRNGRQGRC